MATKEEEKVIIRPFVLEEGLEETRYHAQIMSRTRKKYYNVFATQRFNLKKKEFDLIFECDCEGFYFRKNCSHCQILLRKLVEWGEIDQKVQKD